MRFGSLSRKDTRPSLGVAMSEIKTFIHPLMYVDTYLDYKKEFMDRLGLKLANMAGMTYIEYTVTRETKTIKKLFGNGYKTVDDKRVHYHLTLEGTEEAYNKLKVLINGMFVGIEFFSKYNYRERT